MRFRHSEHTRCQEIRHQSEGGTRSVYGLKMCALQVLFAEEGSLDWQGGKQTLRLYQWFIMAVEAREKREKRLADVPLNASESFHPFT